MVDRQVADINSKRNNEMGLWVMSTGDQNLWKMTRNFCKIPCIKIMDPDHGLWAIGYGLWAMGIGLWETACLPDGWHQLTPSNRYPNNKLFINDPIATSI
jgi:hypothetical protein